MSAQFTPGPWIFEEEFDSAGYKIRSSPVYQACVLSSGGAAVADVRLADHRDTRLTEAARANARLIASAPDLLRELETAVAWIEDSGNLYAPTQDQILSQLRAAIAKARADEP